MSISSPAAGATVSGTITVSGASSGASKVELKVDSGAYQLASGTSSWSKSINTTAYANGSHTLTARATNSAGNQVWASRTITISNGSSTSRVEIYWGAWIGNAPHRQPAPWDMNAGTPSRR